jgi:hypothetical protein
VTGVQTCALPISVPQAQERQALLCSSVLHSRGPLSERLALAQPSITGQPPPTVGVPGSAAESPGMGPPGGCLSIIATRNGGNLTRLDLTRRAAHYCQFSVKISLSITSRSGGPSWPARQRKATPGAGAQAPTPHPHCSAGGGVNQFAKYVPKNHEDSGGQVQDRAELFASGSAGSALLR